MAPDLKKEFLAIQAAVIPLYDRVQKLSTALDLEQSREIDETIEIDNQEYIDALDALDEAIDVISNLTGD